MKTSVVRRLQHLPLHHHSSSSSTVRAITGASTSFLNRQPDHSHPSSPCNPRFLSSTAAFRQLFRPRGNPDVWDNMRKNPIHWPKKYEAPSNWGIVEVPWGKAYVVKRFGRYAKTWINGRHLLIPFVHRIAYIHSLEDESVPTKDKEFVRMEAVVHYRIVEPKLASYGDKNPLNKMALTAVETIREEMCRINSDKVEVSLLEISKKVKDAVNEKFKDSGLRFASLEIKNIATLDKALKAVRELEQEAERLVLEGGGTTDNVFIDKDEAVALSMAVKAFRGIHKIAFEDSKRAYASSSYSRRNSK